MLRKGMTIKDATYEWVKEFNAMPTEMFRVLYDNDYFREVTMPSVGDRIWGFEHGDGEVVGYDKDKYVIKFDDCDDEKILVERNDISIIDSDDCLPMWGTMWSFDDIADGDYWMNDENGIEIMSKCGFRVYYSDEFDLYYFGIDGAGYDFYEEHWIPLYKARGLRWHDPETVNND